MTLSQIKRMPTGCPGLDHVLAGGLPEGRSTLVSGTAGSGKTVLALQFLHDGVRDYEQPGVLSCARNAVKMLEQLPLEILAAAGIDLSNLPGQDEIEGATPIERKAA